MSGKLTKEEYMGAGGSEVTIDHFYEKLLLLRGMMKTESGRKKAESRHAFMVEFLAQFYGETMGER